MYSIEEIKHIILEAFKAVTGIQNVDENTRLVSQELGVVPADFVYIFDLIQQKVNLPVYQIFECCSFEIMTAKKLSEEIHKLQKS